MSIFRVWDWWKSGKGHTYADHFVEVEISGAAPDVVYVYLGQNEDECIGAVPLSPDIAEEFARALLKAAATVRDMQAPKPLSE